MTENDESSDEAFAALKARADRLEKQLHDAERSATMRLRQADLKNEAMRAGIVDLDGLRLLDAAALGGDGDDSFHAANLIARLRREKPWLFNAGSSSSAISVPAMAAPRKRLATEMSVDEWRAARAELLRRR